MIKQNNSFQEIWDFLKSCDKVAMTLHYGPDGDSLGSCTALKYVLEKEGIKVDLVSGDALSGNLNDLDFKKSVDFSRDVSDLNEEDYDCFIFLDCGSAGTISGKKRAEYKFPKKVKIVNIDHHDANSFYGDFNYIDASRSSVCSLLVDFFREVGIEFNKELGKRLMVGLCTDNGFFNHPKDPEDDFEKALFLIRIGVDYMREIALPILFSDSLEMKKLYALVLNNLEVDKKNRIGWSTVSFDEMKNLKLNRAEVRLGIQVIQNIKDIDVVFFLVELEDHIKGSLRSKGRDTSIVAKHFRGGGHKMASGFSLDKMPLSEAVKKIRDELTK